ncbi:Response regulator [Burkholderia dolosa AU0158]|nr:Response regulator [Burkholderia dolosa AU0158]
MARRYAARRIVRDRDSMATILIVDDDAAFRDGLAETLADLGHRVVEAGTGRAALGAVRDGSRIDCIFLDFRLPDLDGLAVLAQLHDDPALAAIPVVMLTAHATSDNTIDAMRLGAFDHLTKPIGRRDVAQLLERIVSANQPPARDDADVRAFSGEPASDRPQLLGVSAALRDVQKQIGRAATSDATVLITGDTGTGKEVAARVLHAASKRHAQPFVAVNCAAIPADLLESELFGHRRGAFTGAHADRAGRLVDADGGTLFLDEIGDMPAAMQAKLLRALQERQVTPLGADRPIEIDIRVIAATHRDLAAAVAARTFREDLFYRLNVIPLHLPPLVERVADILPLAAHFLARAAGARALHLTNDAQRALLAHRLARQRARTAQRDGASGRRWRRGRRLPRPISRSRRRRRSSPRAMATRCPRSCSTCRCPTRSRPSSARRFCVRSTTHTAVSF